jgi:hypothetical protein
VTPATIDGVLKMPAPMTIPTMIATASRRRRSGCGVSAPRAECVILAADDARP